MCEAHGTAEERERKKERVEHLALGILNNTKRHNELNVNLVSVHNLSLRFVWFVVSFGDVAVRIDLHIENPLNTS